MSLRKPKLDAGGCDLEMEADIAIAYYDGSLSRTVKVVVTVGPSKL